MVDSIVLQAAAELGQWLSKRKLHIATAESCTGGGIGYAISAIAGSSDWFHGGIISYSNAVKQQQLGVSSTILDDQGAVSAATAEAMATGVRQSLNAHVGIAVTGIAGPGGATPGKPVGLVWFGLATTTGVTSWSRHFEGNRHQVRTATILEALRCQRHLDENGNTK
ncbi:nicotinamide-nucleotide amidase [Pseudidiomarina planktonica]|uniref:Nicotinamide-nucleotide amidase n=1 Tax=Pseudidiomarina planktonica TaxID=1323738 RepID=A0A1Y6EPW5_9GAMM|nr:CinA family protein [Pseudidiomarina planktonica]RUO65502.1 CinA family protein [Pseudidiomarina planktonica]SMQ64725.1 nicotinamide-nucleotide amidase [Pseudidiomarina planktonica]